MFKTGILSLLVRASAALVALVFNLLIARVTTIDNAGAFYLVVSVAMPLAIISRLGFDHYLVRQIAASYDNQTDITKTTSGALRAILITCVCITLVLIISTPFMLPLINEEIPVGSLILTIPLFILIALGFLFSFFFQGMGKIVEMQFSQNLGANLLFCLIVFAIWYRHSLVSAQTLEIIYIATWTISLTCLAYRWIKTHAINFTQGEPLKTAWKATKKMYTTHLVNLIQQWGIPILLSFYMALEDVAVFTVTYRIAMVVSIMLMAINAVVAPKFALAFAKNQIDKIQSIAVWSTRVMIFLSAPLLLLIVGFPELILNLFGEAYESGAWPLRILALAQLINVATGSVGLLLNMTHNEKDDLIGAILGAAVLLVSFVFLTPLYGLIGAAISQSAGIVVQMMYMTFATKRHLGFMPLNIFAKVGSWKNL